MSRERHWQRMDADGMLHCTPVQGRPALGPGWAARQFLGPCPVGQHCVPPHWDLPCWPFGQPNNNTLTIRDALFADGRHRVRHGGGRAVLCAAGARKVHCIWIIATAGGRCSSTAVVRAMCMIIGNCNSQRQGQLLRGSARVSEFQRACCHTAAACMPAMARCCTTWCG